MARRRKKATIYKTEACRLATLFGARLPEELVNRTASYLSSSSILVAEMAAMRQGRDPTDHELAQAGQCEIDDENDAAWFDSVAFDRYDELYGDLDEQYESCPPADDTCVEPDCTMPRGFVYGPEGQSGDL